jgi:lambda family phage portal protein
VAERNALDRVISYFSPKRAALRASFRAAEQILRTRGYDGAASGRRTDNWNAGNTSAVAEARLSLALLRDRSRDLERNDAYAQRALTVIPANVVGHGIVPQAKTTAKREKLRYRDAWARWAETTACDFDGLNTFYGLQNLIQRAIARDGEVIVRFRYRPLSEKLPLPLQIQVLESDFIDARMDGTKTSDGLFNVQGIEFDADGRRRFYNLYEFHPGGGPLNWVGSFYKSNRIPASEVMHLFRVDRAGQVRGIPWLASVMLKLKDYGDFSEASLMRQKIAACFTAFVTDADNLGGVLPVGSQVPILGETMEPGQIEILKPGQTVTLADPPPALGFAEFSREQLKAVAAGVGISYESLTGDFSNATFSSARMGRLEMQRNVDCWRWQLLIPRGCTPIWDRFAEAAAIAGQVAKPVPADWTPPRKEYVDPTKEIPALISEVRAGFKTWPEAVRETGNDPEATLQEISETNKAMDEAEVVVDTDPRKVTKTGNPVPTDQQDGEGSDQGTQGDTSGDKGGD